MLSTSSGMLLHTLRLLHRLTTPCLSWYAAMLPRLALGAVSGIVLLMGVCAFVFWLARLLVLLLGSPLENNGARMLWHLLCCLFQ
jgi:hypothetical protein